MDLIVRLSGDIKESNFIEYKEEILAMVGGIKTDLQTEEDFAEAEETAKKCKEAEDAIAAAKKAALDQTVSIRELFEAMEEVSGKLRDTRLDLSKQVKTRKDEIKQEIVAGAVIRLTGAIAALKAHAVAVNGFPVLSQPFHESVKGKRTIDSMQKAVAKEHDKLLAKFNEFSALVSTNETILQPYKDEYPALFVDDYKLLGMDSDGMLEIVNSRLAQFKAQEEARKLKAEAKANEAKEFPQQQQEPPAQVEQKQKAASPESIVSGGFVITIVLDCDDAKAIQISKTLNNNLKAYGNTITSVNLNRINPKPNDC